MQCKEKECPHCNYILDIDLLNQEIIKEQAKNKKIDDMEYKINNLNNTIKEQEKRIKKFTSSNEQLFNKNQKYIKQMKEIDKIAKSIKHNNTQFFIMMTYFSDPENKNKIGKLFTKYKKERNHD